MCLAAQYQKYQRLLLEWYGAHGRMFPWRARSATNYQRVVSELLLQRTRARSVADFFAKFVARYPSWKALSEASSSELRSFLEPLGLWRRRAAALVSLSRQMKERAGRFPKSRTDLEALPGVGQYIANAVLMFCHGDPQPLLDVNMVRVLERSFGPRHLADIRCDPYLQRVSRQIVTCENPAAMNWALLDLAALVCTIRDPLCKVCPVKPLCLVAGRPRRYRPRSSRSAGSRRKTTTDS